MRFIPNFPLKPNLTRRRFPVAFAVGAASCALFGVFSNFAPNYAQPSSPLFAAEPTVVAAWEFDSPDDANAWGRNHLAPPTVENGVFRAKCEGWDPFVSSPQFELKPRPGQIVEIRMKSTGASSGELFYASSNDGPFGGYSQQKTVSWEIKHDGEFHRYEIAPNWSAEPQILKFRVDVGRPTQDEIDAGATVEIDYIRVIDLNVAEADPLQNAVWDADRLASGRFETPDDRAGWRSEIFKLDPVKIGENSELGPVFSFEWTDDGSETSRTPYPKATLRLLKESDKGSVALELPIPGAPEKAANGAKSKKSAKTALRTFNANVDLTLFNVWNGAIYRWELLLPGGCELKRLAFSSKPSGPGAFDYQIVGSRRGVDRFGTNAEDADTDSKNVARVEYEFLLRNSGGETIKNFNVRVDDETARKGGRVLLRQVAVQRAAVDPLFGTNPTGDRLAVAAQDESQLDKTVRTFKALGKSRRPAFVSDVPLAPGEAVRVVATLEVDANIASKIQKYNRNLIVETGAENRVVAEIPVRFEIRPRLELSDAERTAKYVPEPRPVESDYEIGAFYFPGWSRRAGWDKVATTAPIRKPLLGWYDESSPEVVDWQIKWAAENGIQFFFVDWYWRNGNISLDHWIKAFQAAKYKKYLKWAVMWANHTGPGTHSSADMRAVTKFWIEKYFNTPEYYKIDGKPVVVIWDRSVVEFDMIEEAKKEGVELKPGEGVAKALEISRQTAIEAGLPGIYFIAMKWPERATDAGVVQKLADETFDATTIYHFMDPGDAAAKAKAVREGAGANSKTADNSDFNASRYRDSKLYPFDDVVAASKPHWEAREKTGILPFIPNLATGWDSRPWHGFRQTVVYGRSVDGFRKICADFKDFADKTGVKRAVLAPVNEWGEGSYIEPNVEFGFGMYEAIRETLCREPEGGFPTNYAPFEIGLGPYDLPEDSK